MMIPAGYFLCPCRINHTMMTEQEEHLTDTRQTKFFTRSTARHLRRKRLHDARRAEKQQEYLCNNINVNCNHEFVLEQEINQSEVITKSKARRLRKKNKAKLLDNCCSSCESNCKVPSPVIEVIKNQESISGKDTEDTRTITKSKARRLRKKNKTKLAQSTCSSCCETYPSTIDPVLLKYIQTNDYGSNCCSDRGAGILNNLKKNYNTENIVEAEVSHIQSIKKTEQAQQKPENLELQEKCSALSCLSRSSGPIQFENKVLTYDQEYDETTEDLVYASQLKQNIVETFQTRITCAKEESRLQGLNTKQFNTLDSLSNLQELVNSTHFLTLDQGIKYCNIEHQEEKNFDIGSAGITSIENTTPYLNNDFEKKTELELFSESNIQFAALSSANELLKNVKNLQFIDSTEINIFPNPITENAELFPSKAERRDKNSEPIEKENITYTNSDKTQLKTELVSDSSRANKNCVSNLNLQVEVETTKVKVFPSENTNKLLNEISMLDNSQFEPPTSIPSKMTNKVSEKSREEIKAEREAKKAAKALAKAKAKTANIQNNDGSNDKAATIDSIKSKPDKEKLEMVIKENIEPSNNTDVSNKPVNTCARNSISEVNNEGKKAELRAERRAKQEAQRAAKQQHLLAKSKVKGKEEGVNNKPAIQNTCATEITKRVIAPKKAVQNNDTHEINLFKHLYHEREQSTVNVPFVNSNIHPAIVRLGTQYACKVIVGSNARCVALLAAVKQLIKDFERPSQADFIRGLEASLQESVAYLHHCRPLAVSMQNALRHLKWQMTQLPTAVSDVDAKNKLATAIDTYILEQIQLADKAISITIQKKISNGDVILTYAYSSLIHKILLDAHIAGKQFRVVVVDGRPWLEGKEQLRRLAKHGIECSYILINALSYVMPEVSKVFLGAHAILANGAVMSRVGTAEVALMARAFNIPVLVACETHKSCERVQTDSIVYNELGNADELAQDCGTSGKRSLLTNWKNRKSLNVLNMTYDVTPGDLVTAVVTELAILPCTSVPVILRIKPSEI